jgi:hypothetical protein
MFSFGPLSSVFDLATFAVMLWGFHSGPEQFRSGWFVESPATQTLVIFTIRTRRLSASPGHSLNQNAVSALPSTAHHGAIWGPGVLPTTETR